MTAYQHESDTFLVPDLNLKATKFRLVEQSWLYVKIERRVPL